MGTLLSTWQSCWVEINVHSYSLLMGHRSVMSVVVNIREAGDIGLFITLVHKVL